MFGTISIGILAAVVWGGLGYAVAKAKSDEAFNPLKFCKTLVIGIILAAIAQSAGVDINTLEGFSIVEAFTALIDKLSALFIKGK